jgi:hypothetical protein
MLYDVTSDQYYVARRQRHAISTGQLSQAGVTRDQRRRLVEQGVLRVYERGVFTMGGISPGWDTALWCASLAAGPGAVAYRGAAAAWWGMDGVMPDVVEVAVPVGRQPRSAMPHRVTPLPRRPPAPPRPPAVRQHPGTLAACWIGWLCSRTNTRRC